MSQVTAQPRRFCYQEFKAAYKSKLFVSPLLRACLSHLLLRASHCLQLQVEIGHNFTSNDAIQTSELELICNYELHRDMVVKDKLSHQMLGSWSLQ